jgi:PAS domain S-box-containing protein
MIEKGNAFMSKHKTGSILIVDDEIETMNPLCDLLSGWGYEVTGFTSGKQALKALHERDFDLLLTDLGMPEMSGIELIEAACAMQPLLVSIIITGQGTIQTAVEAMKTGAFDYVLKPLEFKTLRQILSRAIAVRRLRDSEEKYRAIVEDQTELICRFFSDGTLTFVNDVYCRYFARQRKDIIGKSFIPFIFEEDQHNVMKKIASLHCENPVMTYECRVVIPDGTVCWQQWTSRAICDKEHTIVEFQAVGHDITTRKKAEEELKNSREQLRNLSAHLQSIREKERMSIAREIHDELGQALTALKMEMVWLNNRLPNNQLILHDKMKSMVELVDKTAQTVQRISAELRPGLLDDLGLAAAIEWQTEDFQKRTGIPCEVSLEPEDFVANQDISTAIFRIFQETLTNIVRHADASCVKVMLHEKDSEIKLEVSDNGRGITPEQVSHPRSFGIMGIQERVNLLHGKVEIAGIPQKGTTVTVCIPYNSGGGV